MAKKKVSVSQNEVSKWELGVTKYGARDDKMTKDEVKEVMHWFRQAFGLAMGIVWGVAHLTGFPAIVVYFLFNFAVFDTYAQQYLGVEEEFIPRWDLMVEGLGPSFAIFMLMWILTYTFIHT